MREPSPHPRSAQDVLAASALRTLLARVEAHRRLLDIIKAHLPRELAAHCLECAISDGHLLIYTDGQSWSFQLRFHAPTLLAQLERVTGQKFRSLRMRGLALGRTPPIQKPTGPKISPETARLVERYSQTASANEVGAALSRLAQTLKQLAEPMA